MRPKGPGHQILRMLQILTGMLNKSLLADSLWIQQQVAPDLQNAPDATPQYVIFWTRSDSLPPISDLFWQP